jgi:hypothetical protein
LHGVAVGDFNGDSFLDIAADSSSADALVLLPGGADGFGAATTVDAGAFPYFRIDDQPTPAGDAILVPSPRANVVRRLSIDATPPLKIVGAATGAMMAVSADLDGEGGLDVVATMQDAVSLWRDVDGEFEALPASPVAFHMPTEIAAGDIDGDGRDEIAVGLWEGDRVFVITSDGAQKIAIDACFRPASLTIADLDADGSAEVIAGCWETPTILVFDGAALAPSFRNGGE